MAYFKASWAALGAAVLVAACGGGGDGNQAPAVSYSAVVSFGDSLSDAGTYKVGPVAALGGGLFTVNGIGGSVGADPVPSYNWAQLVSAAAVGKINCSARTGGFGVAEATIPGCTNYAQGGSRVTDPVGPGNKGKTGTVFNAAQTEPVVAQLGYFLADAGGSFTGKELVTVLAGANDIFGQTGILTANATLVGGQALGTSLVTQLISGLAPANQATAQVAIGTAIATESANPAATPTSIITAAITAAGTDAFVNTYANPNLANAAAIGANAGAAATAAGNAYAAGAGAQAAVTGMVTAAGQLVAQVQAMATKGAKHIVVVNLPDVSQTPFARATIVYNTDGSVKDSSQQQLVLAMTTAFNQALQAGLAVAPDTASNGILLVDVFSENKRQLADPAHYALVNIKDVACDLTSPANAFATPGKADGSSLVCNTNNRIPGDTSHYMFADGVHPTPYGHKLLAQYVTQKLVLAGWL